MIKKNSVASKLFKSLKMQIIYLSVLIQMLLSLLEKNRFYALVGVVIVLPDVSSLTDGFHAQTADDSAF